MFVSKDSYMFEMIRTELADAVGADFVSTEIPTSSDTPLTTTGFPKCGTTADSHAEARFRRPPRKRGGSGESHENRQPV